MNLTSMSESPKVNGLRLFILLIEFIAYVAVLGGSLIRGSLLVGLKGQSMSAIEEASPQPHVSHWVFTLVVAHSMGLYSFHYYYSIESSFTVLKFLCIAYDWVFEEMKMFKIDDGDSHI